MVVRCVLVINDKQLSQLRAAIKILGCSSKMCNEAERGDMGLKSLNAGVIGQ